MIKKGLAEHEYTNKGEITLKELVFKVREWSSYLFSRWLVILIFGLIGGILGFAYSIYSKKSYIAVTTFVLEDDKGSGGIGNLAGLASIAGVDLGGSGGGIFQGDNILGLYKSRTMIEQTLLTAMTAKNKDRLLVDEYIRFNHLFDKWKNRPELINLKFIGQISPDQDVLIPRNRLRDSVLGTIVKDITKNYLTVAKPDKKLNTIEVIVRANDEVFAKEFNDALVKNVNQFYIRSKTKKNLLNVNILQHKTDSVRAVMNGAIYSAVAISDATPNLNPTRQIQRVAPSQKAQFSAETNKAILSNLVQNLEMMKMSLLKETPLIQIIDAPVFPLEVRKFGKVISVIAGIFIMTLISVFYLLFKKLSEYLK